MTIPAFIKRRPLWTYFVLTFAVSWGGLLLVIGGPGGVTRSADRFDALLPAVIAALLAGPSAAGILMTALTDGRAGLRGLLSRLLRRQVEARWYAVALLPTPLLFAVILLALLLLSPEFLPGILTSNNKPAHLMAGLATGLTAGVFEELGWTGFATPRMRRRFGVLATGLILGVVWAVWHLMPAFWLGYASGAIRGPLSFVSYLLDPFLFLVAFRVFMVWVYDSTESLFVGMLMHAGLTSSSRVLMPFGIAGAPLLAFDLSWAAAAWAVVAVVMRAERKRPAKERA